MQTIRLTPCVGQFGQLGMEVTDEGDYVLHSSFAKAQSRIADLEAQVARRGELLRASLAWVHKPLRDRIQAEMGEKGED